MPSTYETVTTAKLQNCLVNELSCMAGMQRKYERNNRENYINVMEAAFIQF